MTRIAVMYGVPPMEPSAPRLPPDTHPFVPDPAPWPVPNPLEAEVSKLATAVCSLSSELAAMRQERDAALFREANARGRLRELLKVTRVSHATRAARRAAEEILGIPEARRTRP